MAIQTTSLTDSGSTGKVMTAGNVVSFYEPDVAQNGPPQSTLTWLQSALAANGSFEAVTKGRTVYLNRSGELIWPYTNGTIAAKVAAGDIWLDYCGWPMFYTQSGPPLTSYPWGGRFNQFLLQAARSSVQLSTFDLTAFTTAQVVNPRFPIPTSAKTYPISFPYLRSAVLLAAPPASFIPNLRTPYVQDHLYSGTERIWVYSCFAVLIGRGAYLYCNQAINPGYYGFFINEIVNRLGLLGSGGGSSSGSGSSTGSGTGTGSSTGTSTGSGTSTGQTTGSTAPAGAFFAGLSQLPLWGQVALGAGGLGAAAGLTVMLLNRRKNP
ncbi:MAG: hypothetical protein ACYCU5_14300 [Actinomycetes bacterium]